MKWQILSLRDCLKIDEENEHTRKVPYPYDDWQSTVCHVLDQTSILL